MRRSPIRFCSYAQTEPGLFTDRLSRSMAVCTWYERSEERRKASLQRRLSTLEAAVFIAPFGSKIAATLGRGTHENTTDRNRLYRAGERSTSGNEYHHCHQHD